MQKQLFIRKLKFDVRILIGIMISFCIVLIIFVIFPGFSADEYHDVPLAFELQLHQDENLDLNVRGVSIAEVYPQSNRFTPSIDYYQISLQSDDKIFFETRIPNSFHMITETETKNGEHIMENYKNVRVPMGDFSVYLPYIKQTQTIIINREDGKEMITIPLKQFNFENPTIFSNKCGDGICADNENALTCYSDCSYKLGSIFGKKY